MMKAGKNSGNSVHGDAFGNVMTAGEGNQVTVTGQAPTSFKAVRDLLSAHSLTADDFDELYDAVRQIERELARGREADPGVVGRCLGVLRAAAPDVVRGILAILTAQPVADSIRDLAQRWS